MYIIDHNFQLTIDFYFELINSLLSNSGDIHFQKLSGSIMSTTSLY
jgi:hypothetical protein